MARPLIFALTLFAADARAQGVELLFTEEVGGPYTQNWSAVYLTDTGAAHEIYIRSDGKRGDFFGVLQLDCVTPRYSRWLAVGGYVGEDDVPVEVVRAVRLRFCEAG